MRTSDVRGGHRCTHCALIDDELLAQVRELRERGNSPKQIANLLGRRPSVVAPLVRKIAAEQQASLAPADRALQGCWINPGWSAGLGLDAAPTEWAQNDPDGGTNPGSSGLVGVLIARQERAIALALQAADGNRQIAP